MAINTTTSIKRASTVLGKRCEDTKKNMAALAKKVYGKAAVEMEKVSIPNIPGMKDDVLFAAVNGVKFYFMRGETVDMPKAVAEVLRNAKQI